MASVFCHVQIFCTLVRTFYVIRFLLRAKYVSCLKRNSINSTNLIKVESTTRNLSVSSEVMLSDECTNKNKAIPLRQFP
jgi:hypothetical protein